MNINRNNYEVYFIDYLEGNLSEEDIHDLKVFLLLNEDLSELLEDIDKVKLVPDKLSYGLKNNLKKDELHACEDYYAIALAENLLTPQDRADIGRLPQGWAKIEEQANIYRHLKVEPDRQIHYTSKSRLHRLSYRQIIYKYSLVAAISLLFLSVGLTIFYNSPRSLQTTTVMNLPPFMEVEPFEPIKIADQEPKISVPLPQPVLSAPPIAEKIPIVSIKKIPMSGIELPREYEPEQMRLATSFVCSAELILSETATAWKSSESKFLSNNILSSIIQTGRTIAEKIKNNSNK